MMAAIHASSYGVARLLLTCVVVRQGSMHTSHDGGQVGQHFCLGKDERRPEDSRRLRTQDGCMEQVKNIGSAAEASATARSKSTTA
jgi:hypothetical protein